MRTTIAIPVKIKNFFILTLRWPRRQDRYSKQFFNLLIQNTVLEPIFTVLKKYQSYGRSILVAFLRGNHIICFSHRFSLDLSEQTGEQKQTRQQILRRLPPGLSYPTHEHLCFLRLFIRS
jgi:hypothetical protein